jgi:glycine dehydrogenase subunit 1
MAVAASAYLSILGRDGLRDLARMNIARARQLMQSIGEIKGFESPLFDAYHFNEFVIKPPVKPEKLNRVLLRKGIIGGLPLGEHVRDLADCTLLCTTEMNSDEDHSRLIAALEEIV